MSIYGQVKGHAHREEQPMPETRRCRACGKERPLASYYSGKGCRRKRHLTCLECRNRKGEA